MNIYTNQDFIPMLLHEVKEAFNDSDYIFELKFDGIRALMFVEPKKITVRNKRSNIINNRYPELLNITKNVNKKVIFDGEIVIMVSGKPSFEHLQKRVLLKDKIKINYYSKNFPVIFVAFDILYENEDLTNLTLLERKKILNKYKNTNNFIKSEYIEENGKDLFKFAVKENLEGIVAKKKDSKYFINKRTKDWIKIKYFNDEDFFICGYKEENNKPMASLLLGKMDKKELIFAGTVNIGKKNLDFLIIKKNPVNKKPSFIKDDYIYLIPNLKCTVEFLEKTKSGFMRHPIYKSLKTH